MRTPLLKNELSPLNRLSLLFRDSRWTTQKALKGPWDRAGRRGDQGMRRGSQTPPPKNRKLGMGQVVCEASDPEELQEWLTDEFRAPPGAQHLLCRGTGEKRTGRSSGRKPFSHKRTPHTFPGDTPTPHSLKTSRAFFCPSRSRDTDREAPDLEPWQKDGGPSPTHFAAPATLPPEHRRPPHRTPKSPRRGQNAPPTRTRHAALCDHRDPGPLPSPEKRRCLAGMYCCCAGSYTEDGVTQPACEKTRAPGTWSIVAI
ncbi:hypothetical protein ACRRTK_004973 [Alexandromys fortis]